MRRSSLWAGKLGAMFVIAMPAVASGQAVQPRPPCEATPVRRAVQMMGQVAHGGSIAQRTAEGWILRLDPIDHGWIIRVSTVGREADDLAALTPPWHFVPNPRELEGWHFRNVDNTAPNDGSVNASGELRDFIFSPAVGQEIVYSGSATRDEDVEKVRAFGRGWLYLDSYRLSPPARGTRASFESITYTACLTWPVGAPIVPRMSRDAEGAVGAALRALVDRFPSLQVIDVSRYANAVTATYNPVPDYGIPRALIVMVESFDTDHEADAAADRAVMSTSVGPTRRDTVRGMVRSFWGDNRISGRIGRHVVDVSPGRNPGAPPPVQVFDALAPALERIVPSRPAPPFIISWQNVIPMDVPATIRGAVATESPRGASQGMRYDLTGDGTDELILGIGNCGSGGCEYTIIEGTSGRVLGRLFGDPVIVRAERTRGALRIDVYSHLSAQSGTFISHTFDGTNYVASPPRELRGAAADSLFRTLDGVRRWLPGR